MKINNIDNLPIEFIDDLNRNLPENWSDYLSEEEINDLYEGWMDLINKINIVNNCRELALRSKDYISYDNDLEKNNNRLSVAQNNYRIMLERARGKILQNKIRGK